MMSVNVHVGEKASAKVEEADGFVWVVVMTDGGLVNIFLPKSRIDDARRIARAINNTGDEFNGDGK